MAADETIGQLTAAIASGDTEAFARLYRLWFDRLYAEARRTTRRDESFCLDVVHDAMMRVIRSMKPMPTEAALACWLKRTVQCSAYDRLRAEARRRRREQSMTGLAPAGHADDLAERLDWIRRELADLDATTRSMLLMRHRFGWTLGQIGSALALTTGAVDGRLRRAVATLRQRAKGAFDEP